jgi:hypothetical protein
VGKTDPDLDHIDKKWCGPGAALFRVVELERRKKGIVNFCDGREADKVVYLFEPWINQT